MHRKRNKHISCVQQKKLIQIKKLFKIEEAAEAQTAKEVRFKISKSCLCRVVRSCKCEREN